MKTQSSRMTPGHNGQPEPSALPSVAKRLLHGGFLLLPLVMGFCLFHFEKDVLFRAQELNLFLPGSLFYHESAVYPGGTLQWMACFCTEFFYHPACGVALLTLCWCAICALAASAFRLDVRCNLVTTLIPAALLGTMVQMGYIMFYITLRGYWFTPTLGMLFGMAAVWVYSRLAHRSYAGAVWLLVWMCVGYPLFGAYALASGGYMMVLAWRMPETSSRQRLLHSVLGLLLFAAVPLVAHKFYAQTSVGNMFLAALPSFNMDTNVYTTYRIPFYILFAAPLLCIACYGGAKGTMRRPWLTTTSQTALLLLMAWGLHRVWYRDTNFHKELRTVQAINDGDWQRVLDIYTETFDEPTRLLVMAKNLALFRLGKAGNEMFQYREGSARPNAPFRVRMPQVAGKLLYYQYGEENFCYRWCMEDCVCYGWNVENLKLMAKASLANGDHEVARKYLEMLKRTRYHKAWAAHYEQFLFNSEAIFADKEFNPIVRLMPEKDMLSSDLNIIEKFLIQNFAYRQSKDPLCQEQCLIAALQLKDIRTFWARFFEYAAGHGNEPMPRYFQEAAYLYGTLEHEVDTSRMPFDKEVIESHKRFQEFTQHCAGMTEAQMREAFRPQFGNTFYYFYFLMNGQHTY